MLYNIRYNDVNLPVGHYCRKYRQAQNITLETISSITGVSVSLLSAFENGSRSCVAELIYLLACGMSADSLCKYCETYLDLMDAVDFEKGDYK